MQAEMSKGDYSLLLTNVRRLVEGVVEECYDVVELLDLLNFGVKLLQSLTKFTLW